MSFKNTATPLSTTDTTAIGVYARFRNPIDCHGHVSCDIGKRGPDRSSAPETLSFGEKTVKIGPADPVIALLMLKKKKLEMLDKA